MPILQNNRRRRVGQSASGSDTVVMIDDEDGEGGVKKSRLHGTSQDTIGLHDDSKPSPEDLLHCPG